MIEALPLVGDGIDIRKIEVLDHCNYPATERWDQTLTPVAESAIEVVIRKRHAIEIERGGNYPQGDVQKAGGRGLADGANSH